VSPPRARLSAFSVFSEALCLRGKADPAVLPRLIEQCELVQQLSDRYQTHPLTVYELPDFADPLDFFPGEQASAGLIARRPNEAIPRLPETDPVWLDIREPCHRLHGVERNMGRHAHGRVSFAGLRSSSIHRATRGPLLLASGMRASLVRCERTPSGSIP